MIERGPFSQTCELRHGWPMTFIVIELCYTYTIIYIVFYIYIVITTSIYIYTVTHAWCDSFTYAVDDDDLQTGALERWLFILSDVGPYDVSELVATS